MSNYHAKVAACFKLPFLVKKSKPHSQWPEFKWSEVNVEKLGCGSFGSVYLVKYEKEDRRNVIVKKMKGESAEARRRFEKEAAILNTVKGYRNVSEFLRFCTEPYAIMMEQACFDFTPLGVRKQVNTLEDFVHFLDAEFDSTSFSDGLILCARDIPRFTSTRFTSLRFTSPRFTSPVRFGPVHEIQYADSRLDSCHSCDQYLDKTIVP